MLYMLPGSFAALEDCANSAFQIPGFQTSASPTDRLSACSEPLRPCGMIERDTETRSSYLHGCVGLCFVKYSCTWQVVELKLTWIRTSSVTSRGLRNASD